MISSREIRISFLEFFQNKQHTIVPSAPIVVKNDPTLMFTNAGMNQFKDYFLGNKKAPYSRAADTQKCLRVSGKHNDLEEVGVDHYHHTMFEMLGNWSFGDYFKKEAIAWSWELLTDVYKIDKDRLYVTVFEGDDKEGLPFDQEAYDCWAKLIDPSRILKGNKKDNFWEMGDTGPCGPCSEIHVDMREDDERAAVGGDQLVNNDHPEVIEIWNNVFMEFNRKADGSLEKLPAQHVDTGMGFERLTRVLQGKKSNYDTDIFQPIIKELETISGKTYSGTDSKQDIAFRVIADHIRAVTFCIADGQLPSNNRAGYVIRRILRRALRYGYSYLGMRVPFMYKLVPVLCKEFGHVFPEIEQQFTFILKVIDNEEASFYLTLPNGINKINKEMIEMTQNSLIEFFNQNGIKWNIMRTKDSDPHSDQILIYYENNIEIPIVLATNKINNKLIINVPIFTEAFNKEFKRFIRGEKRVNRIYIDWFYVKRKIPLDEQFPFIIGQLNGRFKNKLNGQFTFELYSTYGFPIDLTQLIASDYGIEIDLKGFEQLMNEEKERSRKDAKKETGDWTYLLDDDQEEFIGYDYLEATVKVARYRVIKQKDKQQFQLVFNLTPFYAESGGQVGDTGTMTGVVNGEIVRILDTQKENDLIIHVVDHLPKDNVQSFEVKVDESKRLSTANNHSATHLLHAALKQVLGQHVAQKGSLVNSDYLRFDFSHFSKVSDEELEQIEQIVNEKIHQNIPLDEKRMVPIKQAVEEMGATALFGEKYGDLVRVITFDRHYSVELCGGTHVKSTGQIRRFKIQTESSVAAGVRRIEAITGDKVDAYYNGIEQELREVKELLGEAKDVKAGIRRLIQERSEYQKKLEQMELESTARIKQEISSRIKVGSNHKVLLEQINGLSSDALKTLSFQMRNEHDNLLGIITSVIDGKPMITVFASDDVVQNGNINCSNIVRELAKSIKGGGGGQAFYATAGGKEVEGLDAAMKTAESMFL